MAQTQRLPGYYPTGRKRLPGVRPAYTVNRQPAPVEEVSAQERLPGVRGGRCPLSRVWPIFAVTRQRFPPWAIVARRTEAAGGFSFLRSCRTCLRSCSISCCCSLKALMKRALN